MEGIFRKSPSKVLEREIKSRFDAGETCKTPTKREECFLMPVCVLYAAIYSSCHVHSIACLNPPSSSILFLLVQNPF